MAFLHTPLGAANPRDPKPIGAMFVEQMEPTGIEPVTSNTPSDGFEQTWKQTQGRNVSAETLSLAQVARQQPDRGDAGSGCTTWTDCAIRPVRSRMDR